MKTHEIRPHEGPQEAFLASSADISIMGGGAFGGKTYALLLEPLRHRNVPGFGCVNFRRTMPQHTSEGGAWDTSLELYPFVQGVPIGGKHFWRFRAGTKITFAHLEHEDTKLSYKSSQIPLLEFDQLEDFSESQFFYMLSRNRTGCGIKPYVRAACNPDPDCFLRTLLDWWIGEDGYPIQERSGITRYFFRGGSDEFIFGESPEALGKKYGTDARLAAKSLTFIPALIDDNPTGNAKDPSYRANLLMLDRVNRERLLKGNWNVRPTAGLYFRRGYFDVVKAAPTATRRVRHWDLAATKKGEKGNNDPDWTAGLKMAEVYQAGAPEFYIEHIERFRGTPADVEKAILNCASSDGRECAVSIAQDPGQAGKAQIKRLTGLLAGYTVHSTRETGDKVTRAGPFSAQSERGNIKLVAGPWVEPFIKEAENFPEGAHDDQIDAGAGALNYFAFHRDDDEDVGLAGPTLITG